MLALPHFSSRIVVGVCSTGLAVITWSIAHSIRGCPEQPHLWLSRLLTQFISDTCRQDRLAHVWVVALLWSGVVTILHFFGLIFEIYAAIPWWDLLTHAMGGSGIAALALLAHRKQVVAREAVWWVVPTLIAIGSGFEVYEFIFRSFWHEWTLRHYAIDTAIDLVMNTLGAVIVASVAKGYVRMTDKPTSNLSTPNHAD